MPYVFDAYGTLFDVHAAISRYRAEAGPEADRFSDLWRTKQLEYTWTLTLAGGCGVRVVEPLGRHGRDHLRFPYRLDQSCQEPGRIYRRPAGRGGAGPDRVAVAQAVKLRAIWGSRPCKPWPATISTRPTRTR